MISNLSTEHPCLGDLSCYYPCRLTASCWQHSALTNLSYCGMCTTVAYWPPSPSRFTTPSLYSFLPDSRRILSVGDAGRQLEIRPSIITVWKVATQKTLLHVDLGEKAGFERATFSPDGKIVMALVGQELKQEVEANTYLTNSIKLWDIERAKELATLKASSATSASFSPDGRLLIEDAALGPRAWDIRAGKMRPLGEDIGGAQQHSDFHWSAPASHHRRQCCRIHRKQ